MSYVWANENTLYANKFRNYLIKSEISDSENEILYCQYDHKHNSLQLTNVNNKIIVIDWYGYYFVWFFFHTIR